MSDAQQPVMTLPERVLSHIDCSHAALEKAAADMAAQEEVQQKIAALIPSAVDAAVSGERIDDTAAQREKLAEICKDHNQLLELFIKVAVHRTPTETAIGTSVDPTTKTAAAGNGSGSYDSLTDPRVGVRSTREKQSSQRLFRGLGLPQPTE